MEIDQSPEEYFRQHAAAALLRSDPDAADDSKGKYNPCFYSAVQVQSWSEIEDTSGTEDDPTVIKKKRILRHGRKRLSEMRERFNAAKAKLFEEKKSQLDEEWAQLQNGTHPQYLELIGQIDARWTDRLARIDLKLSCNRDLAINNLEATQKTALSTFAASRSELRQRMIHRRKRRLWALADELRGLERVSDAIANIACPLSSQGTDGPIRGTLASDSEHLVELPDTRLSKVDEDSDVAAIRGIPALLNNPDSAGDTEAGQGRDAQYAQGYSSAYQYQNEADYARAYQYTQAQQPVAVPAGDCGYYEYRQAQQGYYGDVAATGYAGYPDGRYRHAVNADHPSQSRADATAYPQAYYDNPAPSATPALAPQHGSGKREAVEYDTPSKRQRVQPAAWTNASQARPEYGRADPGSQAYAYSQHAYYGHQQSDYQQAYYGSKYEYPSTYYQQPAMGYSGANGSQPMYYQHDAPYYQSSGSYQQPGYAADYRPANGTSYSGLETGIAMGQSTTDQYGRYAQPQQHTGAWNEYQYGHSGVGVKAPQYYSRQPMPTGRDYYDNGYYTTTQQSQ
ncbi:hypothetical protein IWW42_004961 [Coemansia sp. RSA 1085]|nr:hypothetical protein IWW40_005001 [Coemansia sp. RSA 1250]KAJ2668825.1 hypothetical protein IWW42_004961 [Coemansia sp. RSA 1085]